MIVFRSVCGLGGGRPITRLVNDSDLNYESIQNQMIFA